MAEPEAIANSCRDRDDVLERAAQFHTDDVGIRIDAKGWIAKLTLHRSEERCILRCDGDRGGVAARDFRGEGRAAECTDRRDSVAGFGEYTRNDLAHSLERSLFQTFGCADNHCVRGDHGKDALENLAAMLRRSHANNDLRALDGRLELIGGSHRVWYAARG